MKRGDFRRFANQFQRFGSALLGYVIDVFRYDWKLASWTIGASVVGIGLQAASLGAVLLVARSYEDAIRSGAEPRIDVPLLNTVPPSLALIAIVLLLALSVVLLYESQRAMYTLSVRFADWRAGALLDEYPLVAERIDLVGVEGRSGVPVGLAAEMSRRATVLNRAGRSLFGGGVGLMQFIYGVLFLLWIQPLVTLVIVFLAAPLIVPLRWFTRQVNDAEKGRRALRGNAREELAGIVRDSAGAVPGTRAYRRMATGDYSATKVARNNHFILRRFLGMARSKAVANTGLTLTFAVSIAVFFGLYGPEEVSISAMLVFFVALRVAAMGGRQLIARIARFARFYGPVRVFLQAYHQGRRRRFVDDAVLGVTAPDARDGTETTLTLERGVPFAVFGAFPLAPLNLHMLGVFADADTAMTRGDLVAGMTSVPPEPRVQPGDCWRDWLHPPPDGDFARLFREAAKTCPEGSVPSPETPPDTALDTGEGLADGRPSPSDLGMLAAWSARAQVVVVCGEIIDHLGESRWRAWCHALAGRYLLVYYRAGAGTPCRAGETHAALIDFAGSAVAVAPADWLRDHAEAAERMAAAGLDALPRADTSQDEEDDDED